MLIVTKSTTLKEFCLYRVVKRNPLKSVVERFYGTSFGPARVMQLVEYTEVHGDPEQIWLRLVEANMRYSDARQRARLQLDADIVQIALAYTKPEV